MKILIKNTFDYHHEIIESVIYKYGFVLGIEPSKDDVIYLQFNKNKFYHEYIYNKYPLIKIFNEKEEIIESDFDYIIECTIHENNYKTIIDDGKHFYISHRVHQTYRENVFYLTPLCKTQRFFYADVLPYTEEKKISKIPTFAVIGDLNNKDLTLLDKILDVTTDLKYKIKILGRNGNNINNENVSMLSHLNFQNFHRELLDVFCIITLTSKKKTNKYYNHMLTSTIHYTKAYNFKTIIDKDLQDIYNLDNVEIFENYDDIGSSFLKVIKDFYSVN